MAAMVNRLSDQWMEERSQAPLDKMKDWVRELSAPLVDAVQERMGVAQAGKRLLDEGGEAAELVVLAKKVAWDAVNADEDIVDKIRDAVALYQEAACLLQVQTAGLGSLGRLADSYMERATVYTQLLSTLGQLPEEPPMTDVEWDATKFVKLRQAKAQLGLRPQVGGPGSGRRGSSFFLCMEESDCRPVGAHTGSFITQSSSLYGVDQKRSTEYNKAFLADGHTRMEGPEPTTPIRTSIHAPAPLQTIEDYTVTPTFQDLASISPPPDQGPGFSGVPCGSPQMSKLPRGTVIDEAFGSDLLKSPDVGVRARGWGAADALREPADTSGQLELMGRLEKEFEPCNGPVQNTQTRPCQHPVLDDALSKEATSSQLSTPRGARSDGVRSPRGLSPGGYASKDSERQAASRRALRESRRRTTPPRPLPNRALSAAPAQTSENSAAQGSQSSSTPSAATQAAQGSGAQSETARGSWGSGAANATAQGRLLGVVGGESSLEPRYVSAGGRH